jgi:hypothetical protein
VKVENKIKTTEDTPSIVVRDLYEGGEPRSEPVVLLSDNIKLEAMPLDGCVQCTSRYYLQGKQVSEDRYIALVSSTEPNYGGTRLWLHCASCERRVTRLFLQLDGHLLLCRSCAGLVFPSQAPGRREYRRGRANKIRLQLGGEPGMHEPFPGRPKGMHRRTYDQLLSEVRAIEGGELEGHGKRQPVLLSALFKRRLRRRQEERHSRSD